MDERSEVRLDLDRWSGMSWRRSRMPSKVIIRLGSFNDHRSINSPFSNSTTNQGVLDCSTILSSLSTPGNTADLFGSDALIVLLFRRKRSLQQQRDIREPQYGKQHCLATFPPPLS